MIRTLLNILEPVATCNTEYVLLPSISFLLAFGESFYLQGYKTVAQVRQEMLEVTKS